MAVGTEFSPEARYDECPRVAIIPKTRRSAENAVSTADGVRQHCENAPCAGVPVRSIAYTRDVFSAFLPRSIWHKRIVVYRMAYNAAGVQSVTKTRPHARCWTATSRECATRRAHEKCIAWQPPRRGGFRPAVSQELSVYACGIGDLDEIWRNVSKRYHHNRRSSLEDRGMKPRRRNDITKRRYFSGTSMAADKMERTTSTTSAASDAPSTRLSGAFTVVREV